MALGNSFGTTGPHSTDEAGELVPQDPVEGRKNRKGVPDVGP